MTGIIRRFASLFAFVLVTTICVASQDLALSSAKQFNTVTTQMKCEAMRPDMCPGFYGFSVASDGNFTVGPDAKGGTIEGSITSDELKALTSSVYSQLASDQKVTCMDIFIVPGSSKAIAVSFTDGTQTNLFTEAGPRGRCVLGNYEKAKLVEQSALALLAKYYPRPFPKDFSGLSRPLLK